MKSQKNILLDLGNNEQTLEKAPNGVIHYLKYYDDDKASYRYKIVDVNVNVPLNNTGAKMLAAEINICSAIDYILKRRTEVKKGLVMTLDTRDEEPTQPQDAPTPTPTPTPQVETPAAPNVNLGLDALIGGVVTQAIERNAEKVNSLVQSYLDANGIRPTKTTIEIHHVETGEKKDLGAQHPEFKKVLIMAQCSKRIGIYPFLVGAPATGKSTIAENVAKALNLEFYEIGLSAATPPSALLGYNDANGKFVSTHFYEAYKNGGVFLLDELDNGNPNTTAGLNNAISSQKAAFAIGKVKKHKDFILIATANTYGKGATADFVGRNPIDGATLDRFKKVHIDYDNDLELTFTNNPNWCKLVQAYRAAAEKKKIRTFITPRATISGAAYLAAGMTQKDVLETCILSGLNKDERNLLKNVKI